MQSKYPYVICLYGFRVIGWELHHIGFTITEATSDSYINPYPRIENASGIERRVIRDKALKNKEELVACVLVLLAGTFSPFK